MRDEREKTNQTIFDMFMACHSQEEIAEVVDLPKMTISDRLYKLYDFGNVAKSVQALAN